MWSEGRMHYSPGFGDAIPGGVQAGKPIKKNWPRKVKPRHPNSMHRMQQDYLGRDDELIVQEEIGCGCPIYADRKYGGFYMTINSVPLPIILREFIGSIQWTFAETMPEWPHEYIVRDRVDENLFMMLVQHIRSQGYESKFYEKTFTYYDHGGLVYWTMGEPLGETTIINRCRKEESYEFRRLKGTLPASKSSEAEKSLLIEGDIK